MPSIRTTSSSARAAEARSNRVLGRRITLYRLSAGLSLAELGSMIGAGIPMMSAYENAKRAVPFGRLVLIARALRVPVATLVEDDLEDDPACQPDALVVLQIARIAGRLPKVKQLKLAKLADRL